MKRRAAICLYPEKAWELIRETAAKELGIKRVALPSTGNAAGSMAAYIPGARRTDGKTIEITADDYLTAYHGFLAAVLCAQAVSQ